MNLLFLIFIAISITEIATDDILNKIKTYFESQTANKFDKQWKLHQIPFENSLSMALQEGYGYKSMNVYLNRLQSPLDVSIGYFHTDNQVKIIFQNLGLEELPHIYDADIIFPLSSNALSVDASVSKMIVRGNYLLFRNKSDIIFSMTDQDPYKNSPFRFQQVRNMGNVAITIDGCSLSGIAIATLDGGSVNLGHSQLKLTECEYNLEIYSLGTGAPPVIANYLLKEETGIGIDQLLLRPLVEELIPKLQAAMFSIINTSSIFTQDLSNIKAKQEDIFEETKKYMDYVVRQMNEKSIEKDMGTINLEDFTIFWDDAFGIFPNATAVSLYNMILMGLDTLYSAHIGGPFRLTEPEIAEQLRFSSIEVVGNMSIKGFQEGNEFAVEIMDVAVDVTIGSNLKPKFDVVGWRFLEFSCPAMESLPVESFVVSYLLNEIPKRLTSHLSSVFSGSGFKLSGDAFADELSEHEEAIDGKLGADVVDKIKHNDEERNDDDQLLNSGSDINTDVELNHLEENSYEEGQGPVKRHRTNIVPPKDENELVKLNLKEEQVKLHHLEVQSYEDDLGQVKPHHVDAVPDIIENEKNKLRSEPLHEQVKLHHNVFAPLQNEKGQVKLQHVNVVPENSNQANVKVNVMKEPSYQQVKLHHIAASRHKDDQEKVKLRHKNVVPQKEDYSKVKLNIGGAVPHE